MSIDYILFHTPVWSFAVFNLADAFITVGAVLVMLEELLIWRDARASAEAFGRLTWPYAAAQSSQRQRRTRRQTMPGTFKAILISRDADKKQSVAITELSEADLMEGDVTVAVEYTTVNYKDGLAITGKAPVIRRFPLVPGIDFAGTVHRRPRIPISRTGDKVVLNGWGVGETHHGAFAERARVKGDWLVPLPAGLTPRDAMAVGTAGYTAMLCGHGAGAARHRAGSRPGGRHGRGRRRRLGRDLAAVEARLPRRSPRPAGREESDFLNDLGAAEIISRDELSGPAKPLAKERWAGGVDAVGSHTLANVLSMTSYGGAVAACGLAGGMDLPGSVAPFILRGVSLLGIDSVMAPKALRLEAWRRLARDLDHGKLAALSTTIGFDDIIDAAHDIVEGKIRGRVVVE